MPFETIGLVHLTGFPEISTVRVAEDLYDSLESTPNFTKWKYGVNINQLTPST